MQVKTQIFSSVDRIPIAHWDSLKCSTNSYYSPQFLKAFEIGNPEIEFNYIFIIRDGSAVAFGITQLVTIGVETITKNIRMSHWLRRIINRLFCDNHIRMLFCGNVFLSGEYGTFLKDGEDKVKTFKALAKGLNLLSKQTKKLNGIFVKDFKNESIHITNHLKDFGYTAMQVEPNMIVTLQPEWTSFTDYSSAFKSKYRVKANKADSKSAILETKIFNEDDIKNYKNQLQELYQNTITNADFNAQVLNLDTYIHLKKAFKDEFFVKGYFLKDKLVGFLSAMKNGDLLDAHFIGIDYSKNKDFGIYTRILNDYIRLGIDLKAKQINLGRTASEIKSTLGAQPETLTCYFKHKRKLTNAIISPFVKNVTIKTFKQHSVFK